MRITCLSTYGGHAGGAAVAMHRLAAALETAGATVTVVARQGPGAAGIGSEARWRAAERRIRRRIRHGRTALSNTLFSADWPAWDVAAQPAVRDADVIHVHWVAGFLDAEAIRRLIGTGKPVVWTQHDLRAVTGGCHYAAGCTGFQTACTACPQLAPPLHAVAERTLGRSRRRLRGRPLAFVAPSRWLAAELARARLFDPTSHTLHVIPNGIDLDRYAPPADKRAARARLGLPPDGLAVLLGSVALDERRKGGDAAAAALERFAAHCRRRGGPAPVAVTYGGGSLPLRGITPRHLGPLDEPGVIAALQACDVHLTMTREDNLPNTVVEALACGLPVVGTAVGGLPEMVASGVEGWLVSPDDPAAAAAALDRLAEDAEVVRATAQAARRRALADFDARLQARRHLELYRDLARPTASRSAADPLPAAPRLLAPTPAAATLLGPGPIVRRARRRLRRLLRRVARSPATPGAGA
jgi:glycosyltransferase involved in cell wall biosynthesis